MKAQINFYPLARPNDNSWSARADFVQRGNRLGLPPSEFRGSSRPFSTRHHSPFALYLPSELAKSALIDAFGTPAPNILDLRRHIDGNPNWRKQFSSSCVNGSSLKLVKELEEFFIANGILVEKTLHTLGLSQKMCGIVSLLLQIRGIPAQFPTPGQLRQGLYFSPGWREGIAGNSQYEEGDLEEFERFAVEIRALDRKDARACALGMNSQALSAVAQILGKEVNAVTIEEVFSLISGKDSEAACKLERNDSEALASARRFVYNL